VPLRVAIAGCGLIGHKRARALGPQDELAGCFDIVPEIAEAHAAEHGTTAYPTLEALLDQRADVVVVAVTHDQLAGLAVAALEAGSHVLVEKPAGIGVADVDRVRAAADAAQKLVKVGFNHRFHPGISKAITEARSGRYGEVMSMRARYGHGGRIGYDREWRADPAKSGGGELIDQGMHLLDLSHWLHGELPLHSALTRTQYWDAPVDDNAVIVLGEERNTTAPWTLFHVSWTEWKNTFSMEIYCRTAKFQVDGLFGSYGPERLTSYFMKPELGPPDTAVDEFAADRSWELEWEHFAGAITSGDGRPLLGDLESAHYAWTCVEAAYTRQA
jgi:predicted dehydrogenase